MKPWALLLAGPVLWLAHFMVVYVAVEIGCAAALGHRPAFLGLSAVGLFTLVATVAAAAASAGIGLGAYAPWRPRADSPDSALAITSLVLGAIFAFAILLVGIPALWVEPC